MRKTMLTVALLALAIAAPRSVLAQDADMPIATASSAETADSQRIREAVAYSYDLPKGAPSADYPFVAWCEALVRGHIALGETLTDADPLDAEIIRLGRLEATDFRSALDVARTRQASRVLTEAQAAAESATAQWGPLMALTDEPARAQAFGLFFGLPGRCEHAARRIRNDVTTPPATLEDAGLAPRAATAG
ncbi:MAG: hypothetical protein EON91_03495 [Brevundimonas sp.]|nr:MAG: hypothetical protein EON91_03495 [Brevundimonas sp.]